jgi:hypothetical protein
MFGQKIIKFRIKAFQEKNTLQNIHRKDAKK